MDICLHAFTHQSVAKALKATDKTIRHIPTPALAVSPAMLRDLLQVISRLSQAPTLKCVFILMYMTMLRQSNFAPHSQKLFDVSRHLTRGDFIIDQQSMRVTVKWEKNSQSSLNTSYVFLPRTNDCELCPVAAFICMTDHIPTRVPDDPLAMFADYKPIPLYFLQKVWRKAVTRIGIDYRIARLHGLRRGAATYIAGKSSQARKKLQDYGRWNSSTYRRYIADPQACPVYKAFKRL